VTRPLQRRKSENARPRRRLACTHRGRLLMAALAVILGGDARGMAEDVATNDAAHFEKVVRPILEAKCFKCHGPQTQKASLNLSTAAGIRQGGESGEILDAESPEDGTLYSYVADRYMPPEDEEPLTDEELAAVRAWIESGAPLPAEPAVEEKPLTQHDVLPIVLLRCAICHGRQRTEAGLDLRSVASMLAGGESGPAIVPGETGKSLLLEKIRAEQMPPRKTLAFYSVKPVTDEELKTLTRWIAEGAREFDVEPDVATTEPDPLVTDEDRQFWAFQTPHAAPVPEVRAAKRVRNPVDAFVLRQLEAHDLSLSPEADRQTLIRRAYFDLIGLPPSPEEIDAFVQDAHPKAYERLIDHLLASPHYGERWGQYWLDVAGYSDSEGVQNADDIRPHAWRYRDYVIRAFNDDKPYDRFLLEQLAGDELADYESAETITPEIYDNLVATGFLRMAPDATYAPITGFVPDRLEVIDDEIEILGSAVLGLTIKCARCHSHKFDPIPQRDYYRLAAVFKGALDEHDWLAPRTGGPDQPKDAVPALLSVTLPDDEEPTVIRAMWDRGEPSPTYILRRGNYLTPSTLVGPGVPSVLTDGQTPLDVQPPWPGAKQTGRRLAFARWVTSESHPLTARVMVNRVWKHHFGEGLVRTLDNFGKTGAPPTHPELLDWLAVWFVDHGWSIKQLHRLMMTSAVYRQSSDVTERHLAVDPENQLLSRMPLRRMEGEVLRDTLLAVAKRLDPTPFGPADELDVRDDGLVTAKPRSNQQWRRSIYIRKQRTRPLTILQNFDVAAMSPNCVRRSESIVAPQALQLTNNALVHQWAQALAGRVWEETGDDPALQVERVYRLLTGRRPTSDESEIAVRAIDQLSHEWLNHGLGRRHELAATTHLWIRESEPERVFEDDLISVWSSASSDGARRYGLVEFDLAGVAGLELTSAHLELGALARAKLVQQAAVIPPGIEQLNWSRFVAEKLADARPLGDLGRLILGESGKTANVGAYLRSRAASEDELRMIADVAEARGRLALVLMAEEDGNDYRQDWDDGVYAGTRNNPPRLVVYDNQADHPAARRRALENLCHALINSAAFLYID